MSAEGCLLLRWACEERGCGKADGRGVNERGTRIFFHTENDFGGCSALTNSEFNS